MTFLSQLEWRNAQKSFDSSKQVSDSDLEGVLKAIRFAPSSYGQQPYHVLVVTDGEVRKRLRAASWDQAQVEEASHLLVFCARTDVLERVQEYRVEALKVPNIDEEWLKAYVERVKGSMEAKEKGGDALFWAQRQVYIALGFAMAACAELGIDSCPMEGIEAEKYDEILGLPGYLRTTVALPIGYRKEGKQLPKVRFSEEELFEWR